MKEVKDTPKTIDLEEQISSIRKFKMGKTWKLAKRQHIVGTVQRQNYMIEFYYKLILAEVKALLAPNQPIVFEKDYREDSTENPFSMHSFLTPNIYLHLKCNLDHNYWMEYDFHDCPIEDKVRSRIDRLFEFSQQARQRHLKPNCFEYHKRVIAKQDPQYIYTLQAD